MKTGEKHSVFIGDGFVEQFAAIEAEDQLKEDFLLTMEE